VTCKEVLHVPVVRDTVTVVELLVVEAITTKDKVNSKNITSYKLLMQWSGQE